MKINVLINYLGLLLMIIILIFNIILFRELNSNQVRVEDKINCVAEYFTMPHRTGNTTLDCNK